MRAYVSSDVLYEITIPHHHVYLKFAPDWVVDMTMSEDMKVDGRPLDSYEATYTQYIPKLKPRDFEVSYGMATAITTSPSKVH